MDHDKPTQKDDPLFQLQVEPGTFATVYMLRNPDAPNEFPIIHFTPEQDPQAEPFVFALPAVAYEPVMLAKRIWPLLPSINERSPMEDIAKLLNDLYSISEVILPLMEHLRKADGIYWTHYFFHPFDQRGDDASLARHLRLGLLHEMWYKMEPFLVSFLGLESRLTLETSRSRQKSNQSNVSSIVSGASDEQTAIFSPSASTSTSANTSPNIGSDANECRFSDNHALVDSDA